MAINLQIAYRDFSAPMLAEERIRERVDKLEAMHPRMTSLQVVAEQLERRHTKGKLYRLRLVASMPGRQIAIEKGHADKHAHEDFFVAMRDAFNALEQRLKKFADKQNGDVKEHEVPPHGVVKAVFPDHGFIESSDGLEIYFHANSIVDGTYDDVDVGTEVRFTVAEKEGEKGPQASSVHIIGKHHLI